MARQKAKWLASLPQQPCARCGYHDEDCSNAAAPSRTPPSNSAFPPNTFVYAGPSATAQHVNVATPAASESAMEEGLLIGSDFEHGYGSIQQTDEPVVQEPEEIVVSRPKGKGKKSSQSTPAASLST